VPTVAIELVMLSCVIDAKEGRDVATVDIPGAFMQADMDELVHMNLEGKMAKLLVKLEPKLYHKYIQIEKGKQLLYIELKKPYMAHSGQLCSSGKSYPQNCRSGGSK
jgi:hypothetical protein